MIYSDNYNKKSYLESANKHEQIKILAQLNAVTVKDMIVYLKSLGIEHKTIKHNTNGRKRKWDTAKALELYKQGKFDEEIAEMVGISVNSIRKWREIEKLKSNKVYREESILEQIPILVEQNLSNGEIAERLGIAISTVFNHKREIKKAAQLAL